jgi:hypothetical protein
VVRDVHTAERVVLFERELAVEGSLIGRRVLPVDWELVVGGVRTAECVVLFERERAVKGSLADGRVLLVE